VGPCLQLLQRALLHRVQLLESFRVAPRHLQLQLARVPSHQPLALQLHPLPLQGRVLEVLHGAVPTLVIRVGLR
jgi:hypothetical protein